LSGAGHRGQSPAATAGAAKAGASAAVKWYISSIWLPACLFSIWLPADRTPASLPGCLAAWLPAPGPTADQPARPPTHLCHCFLVHRIEGNEAIDFPGADGAGVAAHCRSHSAVNCVLRQAGRAGREGRAGQLGLMALQGSKGNLWGSASSASATGAPRQLVQRQRKRRRGAAQSVACLVGPLGRQGGHQQHIILAEPTPGLQVAVA
jgi:hypothetical protein